MTLEKCFGLKIGDKVVKVRSHYQNYDHTKVPCEPKIYTISWKGSGSKNFEERVQMPFYHTKDKTIYGGTASGVDNRQICEEFETYEDFISGNYDKGFILDPKYKDVEDFLEVKRIEDHRRAKEKSDKEMDRLKKKYKK